MRFPRGSGILLHITSLPGDFGIGDLGDKAYRFVDFLVSAGQSIWQVLPLTPPARGDSPYSSYSAFAGNPLLISPALLVEMGVLQRADLNRLSADSHDIRHVDFQEVRALKGPLLAKSFETFQQQRPGALHDQFDQFCDSQHGWLHDVARFTAVMEHVQEPDWTVWRAELARRDAAALAECDRQLEVPIRFAKFLQFIFHSQWMALRSYANQRGVRLFGDMPIFVAHDSADVWAHQGLFRLDEQGRPMVVAGVPPDYFSETGQLWGNPLYDWAEIEATNYQWWNERFRAAFEFFDMLRIDHFRGFQAYWEVPSSAETAIEGRWQPGPGRKPFDAAEKILGSLAIVAEDLGLITDDVHRLRDDLGFPGMRVLQFGYDSETDDYHRPSRYPAHSVAYTGTHDNDTTVGWYQRRRAASPSDPLLDKLVPPGDPTPHLTMIRAVLESQADTAIVPLQDLLGLGSEARMNRPGMAAGNWSWRCTAEDLSDQCADVMRQITEDCHRVN